MVAPAGAMATAHSLAPVSLALVIVQAPAGRRLIRVLPPPRRAPP